MSVDTSELRQAAQRWRVYSTGLTARRISEAADEIDRLRANLDEANSAWADAIAQRDTAQHLGRLEFAQSGKWQEMAEDLWEELQGWHDPESCPQIWLGDRYSDDCTCHRILATKWDEITHAADWADDGVEGG